jgi:hypothetical protein
MIPMVCNENTVLQLVLEAQSLPGNVKKHVYLRVS